jgi:hypothetical protein
VNWPTENRTHQRDGFRCVFCGHRAHNVHHRDHDPGDDRASNKLSLCGSGTTGCHGWTEVHPEAAYERGWSVTRFGEGSALGRADTAARRVWLPYGLLGRGWYLLTDAYGLDLIYPQPPPPDLNIGPPGGSLA